MFLFLAVLSFFTCVIDCNSGGLLLEEKLELEHAPLNLINQMQSFVNMQFFKNVFTFFFSYLGKICVSQVVFFTCVQKFPLQL